MRNSDDSSIQVVGTRARVIGRSRVEVLNVVSFTRALGKRTPNLTIQSHMLNRTTNFTMGRCTRIHNINIHSIQSLSNSIYFSGKQSKRINFNLTSNPFGLASFSGPLKIGKRHLFN